MRAISMRTAAVAAVVISAGLNAAGVFSEDEIHWVNLLVGLAIAVVAAIVVFGVWVRRAGRDERKPWPTGIVFGGLAILTLPAFWSGLPPVFAVAAVYLGARSRAPSWPERGRRLGLVAIVLGALGLGLDVLLYAGDIASRV